MSETRTHVMIDLETWSLKPNAAIYSIGAVKFDPYAREIIDSFEIVIDELPWDTRANGPFHLDLQTVRWWIDPKRDAARAYQHTQPHTDLSSALDGFVRWYGAASLPTWAMSATHDLTVLRFALEQYQFEVPWHYRDEHEVRTALLLAPSVDRKDPQFGRNLPGPSHTALTDAIWQTRLVQACYRAVTP